MRNSIVRVAAVVALILLVPVVAMQFTTEVDWDLSDFVIMGGLLFIAGMGVELALKKIADPMYKVIICIAIIAALLLIWAELAVGVFGTPFGGS